MARPRLGDTETKRLQMVITEDELEAIEDWRFKNRVPSKSEAIRRLVQIGLRVEREIPNLTKQSGRALREIEIKNQNLMKRLQVGASDRNELVQLVIAMLRNEDEVLQRHMEVFTHLFDIVAEVAPFSFQKVPELIEALAAANRVRSAVEAGHTALAEVLARKESTNAKEEENGG